MSFEKFCKIVDICSTLHIKNITLIGGEPTLYSQINDAIRYCKEKGIKCGIVTNGIKLADNEYLVDLINAGLEGVSVSLKGEDRETFRSVARKDEYDTVMKAIENCRKNRIKTSVSMVLTNDNIPSFINGLAEAEKHGASSFHLSFCYEFNTSTSIINNFRIEEILKLPDKFEKCYDELRQRIKSKFNLFQTLPFCLWDNNLLKRMQKDNTMTSICQLLKGKGLLFDTDGSLIPCNAMHSIKLGKFEKDFDNADTLIKYRFSNNLVNIYNKLRGVPSEECLSCDKLRYCGGGCVCQWTNFKFDELKPYLSEDSKKWN